VLVLCSQFCCSAYALCGVNFVVLLVKTSVSELSSVFFFTSSIFGAFRYFWCRMLCDAVVVIRKLRAEVRAPHKAIDSERTFTC